MTPLMYPHLLSQADGTWTDIPRCIEHDPGVEEQKTDYCPGVPGYCSLDLPGGLCTFECPLGPDIRYLPPPPPGPSQVLLHPGRDLGPVPDLPGRSPGDPGRV